MIKITACILIFLQGISMYAQQVKFGRVSREELAERVYAPDSSAHAAYLYKFRNSYYQYYKGTGVVLITEIHERIKIYHKEGFPYATKSIELYKGSAKEGISGIKGATYNLVGNEIVKTKLGKEGIFRSKFNKNRDQVKLSMPKVKVGSVIEYSYRITSPFIQDIDEFVLQESIPIKSLEASLRVLEYFKYHQSQKGYLTIHPKVERKMNNTLDIFEDEISYTLKDVPALKSEKFVSNMDNYRSGVQYEVVSFEIPGEKYLTFSKTWEDVAQSIYKSNSFGSEIERSGYFEEELDAALEGISGEAARAKAVLAFVKNKVKWNSYRGYTTDEGVKTSYREGAGNIGDLNIMLISMLNYAGITTHPVLVSTRDHGIPLFPTLRGFNYVVAAAKIGGEMCLLDASNTYSTLDVLPLRALNWYGRMISENGSSEMISLSPKMKSVESAVVSVRLREDGGIEGKMRQQFTHQNALEFRNDYFKDNQAAYVTALEKDLEGLEITNYELKNGKALDKPVSQSFGFYKEDMVEHIADKLYFNPLFHLAETENPFISEKREYPVEFGYPWMEKSIVTIQIPDGYAVASLPEPMAISLPGNMGSFKYLVSQNDKVINVKTTVSFETPVIAPGMFGALKEFYRQLVEKETEKVVLSKITEDEYTESTAGSR